MQAIDGSMISRQDELAQLLVLLALSPRIGIDTEFVRERTYFPQLCLLQVATEELVACIDCLAPLDLEPLFDTLLQSQCVLHSARQDLEIVWNSAQRLPVTLFDTQIAAGLIGFAPQIGLQELTSELLGVDLEKSQTRTNWAHRPLSTAAFEYALDDVRHLLPLAQRLYERLTELGRYDWFVEDCERVLASPPIPDDLTIWQRLKGLGRQSLQVQTAGLALVRWREQRARKLDRPRRWVLSDEQLTGLAKALPTSLDEIESMDGLPRKLVAHSGRDILAAVAAAGSSELESLIAATTDTLAPDKNDLRALQAEVKSLARELGINAEILATKRDLTALACGRTPSAFISGWRATVLAGSETLARLGSS